MSNSFLERKHKRSSRPLASLTPSFITVHSDPHHRISPDECVANKIGPSRLRVIYSLIQMDGNSVSSVSDGFVSRPISSCGFRITDCRVLQFTDNIVVWGGSGGGCGGGCGGGGGGGG